MRQLLTDSSTIPVGLILGCIVTLTTLLVWLTGLVLVLRGSKPQERASILRAYAICRPPLAHPPRLRLTHTRAAEPDRSKP